VRVFAREVAKNAALAAISFGILFSVLEIAARTWVDFDAQAPIGVLDVDWDQPLRFLPGSRRTYRTSEFSFTVAFNRYGRRDAEWSADAIADPRSILLIGDSFALGNAVEEPDTIPARIEARLAERGTPTEVMNFGMPGGAPPLYAQLLDASLREGFGAGTIVVALFVGNDFYPGVFEPLRPTPMHPPEPSGSALFRWLRIRVGQSPTLVGLALTAGRWLGVTVYDSGGSYIFLREQTSEQRRLFERILGEIARMRDVARNHGRRLYVVLIPNKLQVENGDDLTGPIYDASLPNRRILAWCEEREIACLDLLPDLVEEFRAKREPLYYPIDRHFNPRGYAFAADRILEFLSARGAIDAVGTGLREPGLPVRDSGLP
jgi:lysophospholipase L1-like esterase